MRWFCSTWTRTIPWLPLGTPPGNPLTSRPALRQQPCKVHFGFLRLDDATDCPVPVFPDLLVWEHEEPLAHASCFMKKDHADVIRKQLLVLWWRWYGEVQGACWPGGRHGEMTASSWPWSHEKGCHCYGACYQTPISPALKLTFPENGNYLMINYLTWGNGSDLCFHRMTAEA